MNIELVLMCALGSLSLFASAPLHPARGFGLALVNGDGTGCLTMQGEQVSPRDSLLIVVDDFPGVIRAGVEGELRQPCEEHHGIHGDSVSQSVLRLYPQQEIWDAIGVAVTTPRAWGTVVNGRPIVLLPGVDRPLTFRSCVAKGAVVFTVWQGHHLA
jgi:hypothetical protein